MRRSRRALWGLLLLPLFVLNVPAQDKHTLRVCNETKGSVSFDIIHTDGVSGFLTDSYVVSGTFSVPTGQCVSRLWGFSGWTAARGYLDVHVDGKHIPYEQPVRSTAREDDGDGRIEGANDAEHTLLVCIPAFVHAKWKAGEIVESVPIPDISRCDDKEKMPVNLYFSRNGRVQDFTLFVRPTSISTSIKSTYKRP